MFADGICNKNKERESYCEFSMDSLSFWLSKGKLPIFQESFITHCNFIKM